MENRRGKQAEMRTETTITITIATGDIKQQTMEIQEADVATL